jgi:transposase InsO family protein
VRDHGLGNAEGTELAPLQHAHQRLLHGGIEGSHYPFRYPGDLQTDQDSQFTSAEFTGVRAGHKIQISMDGRGRCHDNIFVERLWWTVKHEWIYLRPCDTGIKQRKSLAECFDCYNRRRPHQSLGWKTPDETYSGTLAEAQPLAA